MSRRRRGRDVHGILLLDKPAGLSSNSALQRVKRLYRAGKAGHTGNLDVPATGLLPICLGEATKITPYLLDANKRYRSRIRLGTRTTTGDAGGAVIETMPVPPPDRAQIEAVLRSFRGPIEQVPPMYSALKHQGQRLYEFAARGITIERQPRTVTIHELALLHLGDAEMEVEVACSKGTYIRTLAEDIGTRLGTCAHVAELRRLEVRPFSIAEALTLEALAGLAGQGMVSLDAALKPMDLALTHLPAVTLSEDTAYYLRHGQAVRVGQAPQRGWLRLYDNEHRFLGMGQVLDDGRVAPRRLVNPD